MTQHFIPKHGAYEELLSYRKSVIVYDGTVCFCDRFMHRRDRTVDQMVQAARSGKQNIIEGCMASATSRKSEIKLVNVARASLEELLEDYRDYLRVRGHTLWHKTSEQAMFVRKLGSQKIRPMRPIGPISKPAHPKPSPTSSSASFTRPTTCLTGKSGSSRKPSSKKAASPNA